MHSSRLWYSFHLTLAREASALTDSGMAREGGETKLSVTSYSERILTSEWTVRPFFKSPTKFDRSVLVRSTTQLALTQCHGDTVDGTQFLSDAEDV